MRQPLGAPLATGLAAVSKGGLAPVGVAPLSSNANGMRAVGYCVLLALQFGLQPTLVKTFTPDVLSKKTIVIATEVSKILITLTVLFAGESTLERTKIFSKWTISDSLQQAALPAILYALQNVLTQYGYQMLDSVTFNLLNQTKILSSAFCLWIVMKQKQSARQIFALFILLQAALLLSLPKDMLGLLAERAFSVVPLITTHLQRADFVNAVNAGLSIPRTVFDFVVASAQTANVGASGARYQKGVLMVMAASALSGVCAALTQRSLQQSKRNALFYSAEMAVYGIIALLVSSLNLSFNKGGLSLDPSGLEELTRGVMFPSDLHAMNIVKRNPLWVFIPIIVNVSFSPLSLSPSLPLSLSLSLSLSPLSFSYSIHLGFWRSHRRPRHQICRRRQQGLRHHRWPFSVGRGAVGSREEASWLIGLRGRWNGHDRSVPAPNQGLGLVQRRSRKSQGVQKKQVSERRRSKFVFQVQTSRQGKQHCRHFFLLSFSSLFTLRPMQPPAHP
jgi:drug/metabolite transporter (DMT)-like permease